ncbi:MAG: carbonic anhydrase [Methanomicrobiales archaeon]|nr:carbonic anhydrase [Methanomicrobiales archaeon]
MIDAFLEGNKVFLERDFKKHSDRYKNLAQGQSPHVLWIGCSDSRVNPERVTWSRAGELFVQRNIGNIIPVHDWNVATVLEYAINHLKVKDIVICGHSDCGAMKALDKETNDVYIPLWLGNAHEVKARVDRTLPPSDSPERAKERKRMIEQENVRLQVEHLQQYPLVKNAVKEGKITIHGLYYNLDDGTLTRIM